MIKVSRGCLGEEELAEVRSAFEYGYFGLASKVDEFEEALKSYLGASHVVATNTGTTALHLALDALGIGAGDEVIVPSVRMEEQLLATASGLPARTRSGLHPSARPAVPAWNLQPLLPASRQLPARTRSAHLRRRATCCSAQ